jgi:hypothetical protein
VNSRGVLGSRGATGTAPGGSAAVGAGVGAVAPVPEDANVHEANRLFAKSGLRNAQRCCPLGPQLPRNATVAHWARS